MARPNLPQFDNSYDMYKMRALVDELSRWIDSVEQGASGSGISQSDFDALSAQVASNAADIASISGSVVTDHGSLSGLGDNDHSQYPLRAGAAIITGQWTFQDRVDLDDGAALRIHDSTDTDYGEFSHDGTDFNFDFTGTTDLNITGITTIQAGTVDADFDDITATTYGGIAEANLLDKSAAESIAGQWDFNARVDANADLYVYDELRIYDAGGTDYGSLAHDGTDLNWTFSNTTDLNISGITSIQAGTVDADFDAITATSYGGITEANLLDKSAAETIAGQWDFDARIDANADLYVYDELRVYDAGGTDYGSFSHDGTDFNTDLTNTTDWNVTGLTTFALDGSLSIADNLILSTDVEDQLTADQDDYTPTGWDTATLLALNTDGNDWTISGIGDTTQQEGKVLMIQNFDGSNSITLEDTGTGSTAGNRFVCPGGNDVVIGPKESALLIYKTENSFSRWRVIGVAHDQSVLWANLDANGFSISGIDTLRLDDTASTDYVTMRVSGNNFDITGSGVSNGVKFNGLGYVQLQDGANLRIKNAGNTDYAEFSHDGTDFNTDFTNTTSWNVSGLSGGFRIDTSFLSLDNGGYLYLHDGGRLRIYDSGDTDYGTFYHNGTDFYQDYTNTTYLRFTGIGTGVLFLDGVDLRVYDSGNTDYLRFYHDGSYGYMQFVNATLGRFIGSNAGYRLETNGRLWLNEVSAAGTDYADYGQIFVKNDTPNTLWFRDDGGTEYQLGTGSSPTESVYNSAGYMHWEYQSASLTDGTWYTIAVNPSGLDITSAPTGAGGSRAEAHFIITDQISGAHGSLEFIVQTHYGRDPAITVLSNSNYGGGPVCDAIRLVQHSTYDGAAVQIKAGHTGTYNIKMRTTQQSAGFTFYTAAAETPEGTWYLYPISLDTESQIVFAAGAGYTDTSRELTNFLVHNDGVDVIGTDGLKIFDNGLTDSGKFYHNGARFFLHCVNTDWFEIDGITNGWLLRDGNSFRLYDSGNTDYGQLQHDGTDFNLSLTNTTDLNFSGAAGGYKFDGDTFFGGDTTGHFETVSGNYGSVQVDGADGSSGSYSGYSIGGRHVLMDNGSTIWGLYNDTNNEWAIRCIDQAAVQLYYQGTSVFLTQQHDATGQTSGALIVAHDNVSYDVGFNQLPKFGFNTSDTLEAQHCGHVTGKTNTSSYTLTGPTSGDTDFPVDGVCTIMNLGSSTNYTLNDTATCTMYVVSGSSVTDIAGAATIAPGGVVTLWRYSTTVIYLFGSGLTP